MSVQKSLFCLILFGLKLSSSVRVCNNFLNYLPLASRAGDCWNDPDGDKNSEFNTIVSRWNNQQVDTFRVTTEDGYYLTVFRIPSKKNNSQPVFIQHSFFMDPVGFVDRKEKSTIHPFVAEGYDVWVGNFRGLSRYNKDHKVYNTKQKEFWSFCFQELGVYDLPSMLNLVKQKTGRSDIIYVGFGLGSTAGFVYGIEKANEASQTLKAMVHMAPMAFQTNVGYFPKMLVMSFPLIKLFFNTFFNGEIPEWVTGRNSRMCTTDIIHVRVCDALFQLPFGLDLDQQDSETLPVISRQNRGSYAVGVLEHYIQTTKSRKFQKFDFGKEKNMEKYNNENPPSYDLSKINVKQLFFIGKNDKIGDEMDARMTFQNIPKSMQTKFYIISYNQFGHADFIQAKDIDELLHRPMMASIKQL